MKIWLFTAAVILLSFSVQAQEPVNVIWEADAKAKTVTFSPDGLSMFTGGLEIQNPYSYGNIRKWDVVTKNILYNLTTGGSNILGFTNDISVSHDGSLFASGHGDIYCVPPSGGCYNSGTGFFVSNVINGGTAFVPPGSAPDGIVMGVSFSGDGEFVAMGMRRTLSPQINIYTLSDYQLYHSFTINNTGSFALVFSPVENILASGMFEGHINLWNVNTKQLIRTIQHGNLTIDGYPVSIAFSPDGSMMASGADGYNTKVKVWNVSTGNLIYSLDGVSYGSADVAFSPNGEYLAAGFREYISGGWSGKIKIWRLSDGEIVKEYLETSATGNDAGVTSVAFSSIGYNWFAYAYNNSIKFAQTDLVFNSPVPVELSSFTAGIINNSVLLKWETSSELNNKGFEVERKRNDEKNWITLSFIPGYGSTTNKHSYEYSDNTAGNGKYTYRLRQIDFDGTFKYSDEVGIDILSPKVFALKQNYPNPFNPSTKIRYSIPEQGLVKLQIFDMLGNEAGLLVNENKSPGDYEVEFNAANLASGVYISRLTFNNYISSIKLILSK